ncbi:MAG TPA: hypothetical protein VEQ41_01375 [Solirubrobacterales bacterium]|nr:hypothetical protein [Solirubrobacterales bacterium]
MKLRIAILSALSLVTALAVTGPAVADHGPPLGANFGIADAHNGPGDPGLDVTAPAFPGTKAYWAGTCDTADLVVDGAGVGDPPDAVAHCIDHGHAYNLDQGLPRETTWQPGFEPDWRLDPVLQAGGRFDASISFWLQRSPDLQFGWAGNGAIPDGEPRDIFVELPPGIGGNPNAVPKCPSRALVTIPPSCPPQSQVGIMTLTLGEGNTADETGIKETILPWYNVEPRDGKTAELFFSPVVSFGNGNITSIPVVIEVRTDGDGGLTGGVIQIPGGVSLLGQTSTFWGVPWAPEHDSYRVRQGFDDAIPEGGLTGATPNLEPQPYEPSWGPIRPFAANPTACSGQALKTTWVADSWQMPADLDNPDHPNWKRVDTLYDEPLDGCEKVPFDPDFSLRPTTKAAETPTGLDVELTVPQRNDAPFAPPAPDATQEEVDDYVAQATGHWKSDAGLATSHMKDTASTLPLGITVNPSSAQGQQACTEAQIGLKGTNFPMPAPIRFNNDPVRCPDASKIGTIVTETPVLDAEDWPKGAVYLAEQKKNPFGSMIAIYLAVESAKRGLLVKAAGEVKLDPATGQITTVFTNNPQLPLEQLELHFKGGALAPLVTPSTCGSAASHTEVTPWARPNQPVAIDDPISITSGPNGSPCPASLAARPFDLGFEAGTANPIAGAHTPFNLRITRPDGAQEIDRLELKTPQGFTASLKGIPYCSEAQIAAAASKDGKAEQASPSCPAASAIGTVLSAAGAGPNPLYVPGKLYLSGPYKGAPLSMAAIIPAVAGPFDLGVVVVRTALRLDTRTAQITAVTDPLPRIIDGIPLRIRDIRVSIDRPGFALNPTSCAEQQVDAKVFGSHGAVESLTNRFQVGGCEALGFKPKLSFRLKGGTRRGDLPALTATLKARPGDANIGRVAVTLPGSAFLEQAHLDNICTRVQFAARACPKGSVYGHATAWTPLLDQPLQGPVYLRSSDNRLPDMVAALDGQIAIEVAGRIDTHKGRIRNTFDVVPDAAVSRFKLTLKGGKKGILVNSRNLCARPSRAQVRMRAHNGRRLSSRPVVRNDCKKKKRKGGKGKKRKR